ncbi:hypothetical protein C8Q77DRAFT_1102923 [Trametes polyzona]|nr:hypothetical protein C8Q77DRAFT_1102923 [Trametes polyzona]
MTFSWGIDRSAMLACCSPLVPNVVVLHGTIKSVRCNTGVAMSSTLSSGTPCSPTGCASAVAVNASCLAETLCLCADDSTVWAVYRCLLDICPLLDVAQARTNLLLQCQAADAAETSSEASTLTLSTESSRTHVNLSATSTSSLKSSTPALTLPSVTESNLPLPSSLSSNTPLSHEPSITIPNTSPEVPMTLTIPEKSPKTMQSLLPMSVTTMSQDIHATRMCDSHHVPTTTIIAPIIASILGTVVLACGSLLLWRKRRRGRRPTLVRSSPSGTLVPLDPSQGASTHQGVKHRLPTILWLSPSNFAQNGSQTATIVDPPDLAGSSSLPGTHNMRVKLPEGFRAAGVTARSDFFMPPHPQPPPYCPQVRERHGPTSEGPVIRQDPSLTHPDRGSSYNSDVQDSLPAYELAQHFHE